MNDELFQQLLTSVKEAAKMHSIHLSECPLCGGKCIWCDSVPDDGIYHECDHILCTNCGMDFNLTVEYTSDCGETIHDCKVKAAQVFNKRNNT